MSAQPKVIKVKRPLKSGAEKLVPCEKCGTLKDHKDLRFPYDIFDNKAAVRWCVGCMRQAGL